MTIYLPKDRRAYRYDFWLFKQRYRGSTGFTSEGAARRFEEALQRELRLEAGGLVPHRLLKAEPDALAVAEDGSVRVFNDDCGAIAGYAERLRTELLGFLDTPAIAKNLCGVVYFVGVGGVSPIKIGFATNINARLRKLRTDNPQPLKVLATIPGSKRVENHVHEIFSDCRIGQSEWFRSGDALRAFLQLLAEHPIAARTRFDIVAPACTDTDLR